MYYDTMAESPTHRFPRKSKWTFADKCNAWANADVCWSSWGNELDTNTWRQDLTGRRIRFDEYGMMTKYGLVNDIHRSSKSLCNPVNM